MKIDHAVADVEWCQRYERWWQRTGWSQGAPSTIERLVAGPDESGVDLDAIVEAHAALPPARPVVAPVAKRRRFAGSVLGAVGAAGGIVALSVGVWAVTAGSGPVPAVRAPAAAEAVAAPVVPDRFGAAEAMWGVFDVSTRRLVCSSFAQPSLRDGVALAMFPDAVQAAAMLERECPKVAVAVQGEG